MFENDFAFLIIEFSPLFVNLRQLFQQRTFGPQPNRTTQIAGRSVVGMGGLHM